MRRALTGALVMAFISTGAAARAIGIASNRPWLQLHVGTGHSEDVTTVAFRPDGRLLASASWDARVKLWHGATGGHVRALTGHTF